MAKKQVMEGNAALAEAAVRGDCRFFAGYPITPQSTITEYLSSRMFEVGGTFIQAESEIGSVFMVQGASAVGARAMTATSGQGFSLMTEGMSMLNAQDFPAVIKRMSRPGDGAGDGGSDLRGVRFFPEILLSCDHTDGRYARTDDGSGYPAGIQGTFG
ncbi:MAG: hypothetical protein HFI92_02385 [Lachnospiraceae bacterium]|nr:hypothetical protein [Lachnospiraceae bacterium]